MTVAMLTVDDVMASGARGAVERVRMVLLREVKTESL